MIRMIAALVALLSVPAPGRGRADDLDAERTDEAVIVKAGAKEILRYQVTKPSGSKLAVDSACYFHPLATPKGTVITDVAPSDHLHHRGIFLGWVEMHGKKDADFWGWGQHAPKDKRVILNREAGQLQRGEKASFQVMNDWLAEDVAMLHEYLTVSVHTQGSATVLDLSYQLTAPEDVKLSRWAFSGFCVRCRKDGKADAVGPEGPVKLAAPNHMKPETDWPAAAWYGYNLTFGDGTAAAAAVIDHPKNPPALWHNAISIRMLNPCIVAPKEVVLKAGERLELRYRVVAQDGALDRAAITKLAEEFRKN